jgi:diadenosine tetraphosphate (Ap4A) HIT family hydrolase
MLTGQFPSSSGRACALCRAIVEVNCADPCVYNTKLLETSRFIVIPSVGPLVRGHVLVVSKSHAESLASMGPEALREYDDLAAQLRNAPLLRDTDPLEAEHGSTGDEKAGACVVHTHVHWLPGMGRFLRDFQERLTVRSETVLSELNHTPYIFVRSVHGHAILDARGLASQMIRRILCDLLDRDDCDWTQATRRDLVEETVGAWLSHGGNI